MNKLWCDLLTDDDKANYILSGQAYASGVIAHAIQADVAMAFHRCSEYAAEVRRLREENERLRKDAERLDWIANEYTHIEPFGIPTGEGDSETGWKVSQEQCGQIKPKQLSVVYKDSLREAIDAARGVK